MASSNDLVSIAHDVAAHPDLGKSIAQGAAAAASSGLGINVYLGYFEKGVGLAVAFMGLLVTIALWHKLRSERREIELRIQQMERQRLDTPD